MPQFHVLQPRRWAVIFTFPAGAVLLAQLLFAAAARADDWPQWRGPQRDGVWREEGILETFPEKRLEILWRAKIGPGYCGPTVAKNRVFVTDRQTDPKQIERVHCFDAKNGAPLWKFEYPCEYKGVGYDAGPRACVTIDDNRAFALGSMGNLHCLDVGDGTVLWKKDCNTEYKIKMPIWGIAAAPLIFEKLVIVQIGGADGACLVAFDKRSGEEKWRALNDRASYSAPILIEQAGEKVLVCWTGDSVAGLEPASGKVHWRYPFPPKNMVIGIATPVVEDNRLFVTSFYDGSLMLRLAEDKLAVEKLWQKRGDDEQRTEALHSIISTPVFIGDHIYGDDSYGELRCLDANTGERIWEDRTATPRARWSNIHFTQHGDRVWLFNEAGELIISELSPEGFKEISRAKFLSPTKVQLNRKDGVCWSPPAFANKHVFNRNDEEIVCASVEAGR